MANNAQAVLAVLFARGVAFQRLLSGKQFGPARNIASMTRIRFGLRRETIRQIPLSTYLRMNKGEITDMITRRSVLKSGAIAFGSMVLSRSNFVMAAASNYGIKGQIAPELHVDYWIDENGDPATFKLAAHEGKWVFLKCFQSSN